MPTTWSSRSTYGITIWIPNSAIRRRACGANVGEVRPAEVRLAEVRPAEVRGDIGISCPPSVPGINTLPERFQVIWIGHLESDFL